MKGSSQTFPSPYELAGDPGDAGPFVFTCEHASNHLPADFAATPGDRRLLEDHWGWDIGAADVTRSLLARLGGQAVLGRISRLVADLNREPADPAFALESIDGRPVSFNTDLDPGERARRAEHIYEPYHQAVDRALEARGALGPPVHLVSIHSFTPVYLGRPRPMEIGVLFDDYDELAWQLEGALAAEGFESALNAPYSGKPPDRLIHSAHQHGRRFEIPYLELEIRQDLIETPERAAAVAERVARALEVFRPS